MNTEKVTSKIVLIALNSYQIGVSMSRTENCETCNFFSLFQVKKGHNDTFSNFKLSLYHWRFTNSTF